MKLKLTFKTPDVLDQAINEAIKDLEIPEGDSKEDAENALRDLYEQAAKKYVKHGEYITIEIQTHMSGDSQHQCRSIAMLMMIMDAVDNHNVALSVRQHADVIIVKNGETRFDINKNRYGHLYTSLHISKLQDIVNDPTLLSSHSRNWAHYEVPKLRASHEQERSLDPDL